MDEDLRTPGLRPWAFCAAVMLGPSLLVWSVRLTALFAGCAPGPGLCRGLPLGAGLRDTLNFSWLISTNAFLLVALSLVATLLAFRARRPLTGTLSLLTLPALTPVLPILAVLSARYDGCAVSTDLQGSCQLWGAAMGMSFHNAAIALDTIFDILPYSFALSFMLGVLGYCFARPRPVPAQAHAADGHQDPY